MLIAAPLQQQQVYTQSGSSTTITMDDLEFLKNAEEMLRSHSSLEKFDVGVVDRVVHLMNSSGGEVQQRAVFILAAFKEDQTSWTRVDAILEFATLMDTKYYGLSILETMIETRWKLLPREQAEGIKGFIVSAILTLTKDAEDIEPVKLYLQKLDLVLVKIVKHEWPRYWPTFIGDIVASSRANAVVCANNMVILRLLSEEVFEFGSNMVSGRAFHLKEQFCQDFEGVHQLCKEVLETSNNADLAYATLRTLHCFLHWIPVGYVFSDNLIDLLTEKFLPYTKFRSISVQCLVEISSITLDSQNRRYEPRLTKMFTDVVTFVNREISSEINVAYVYQSGSTEDQKFLSNLAQFFVSFFREHISLVENPARDDRVARERLDIAVNTMLRLSEIEDVEVFKICLDFWNWLCGELYRESPFVESRPLFMDSFMNSSNTTERLRRHLYRTHLSQLRTLMISRMVKPEEVVVVVNENNEAVRELVKDTDSMILYRTMRETLVTLTHLNPRDTEMKMTEKLQNQVNGAEWSWKNLNTLCWAIGSISGALSEEDEKRFLVVVIRDLLGLCEQKRGKDNKAVIASNIMYVVGQYPRFLRVHWKFLKTVINKLFEFMHESHEGVQDMACDTFIKIVMKCKNHFTIVQPAEQRPFIDEILENINLIIIDLSPPQIHVFYEAVGYIVAAESNDLQQTSLVNRLMEMPNSSWDEVIVSATNDVNIITSPNVVKNISHILKTNVAACKAIGVGFFPQLERNMSDMLGVYQITSGNINQALNEHGPEILKQPLIKQMRAIKKEILVLLSTFISRLTDNKLSSTMRVSPEQIAKVIVEPVLQTVLQDYNMNIPEAREPKVLSLLAITITSLRHAVAHMISPMVEAIYECTLDMIAKDTESFPEHRTNFFVFIAAFIRFSFGSFFEISENHRDLTVQAIHFGMRHTMRSVSEPATDILRQLVIQIGQCEDRAKAEEFYKKYFMSILENVIAIASDYNQVPFVGLTNMAETMCVIFEAAEETVASPLYEPGEATSNVLYVIKRLGTTLKQVYPHLSDDQIRVTLEGFFSFNKTIEKMRDHIRDFLVQIRQFQGEDTADLYLEEKAKEIEDAQAEKNTIPGVQNPHAIRDDEDMQ